MSKDITHAKEKLCDLLWWLRDKHDLYNAITDFLTPWEIDAIAERIEIVEQLKSGKSQRQVAELLWVSITTVSRWSRVLQYGSGFCDEYL